MSAAYLYFGTMVLLMVPLVFVHLLCMIVTGRHPELMPDNGQRWRYQQAEGAMALTCLAMLWYMAQILGPMASFCATDPVAGFIAHMPWVTGTGAVLVLKTRHLMRLMAQMRRL